MLLKKTFFVSCVSVIVLDWLRHGVSGPGGSLLAESVDGSMLSPRDPTDCSSSSIGNSDHSFGMLCAFNAPCRRYPNFSFTVDAECKQNTAARTGTLRTPHGEVKVRIVDSFDRTTRSCSAAVSLVYFLPRN